MAQAPSSAESLYASLSQSARELDTEIRNSLIESALLEGISVSEHQNVLIDLLRLNEKVSERLQALGDELGLAPKPSAPRRRRRTEPLRARRVVGAAS
ncbi:hypothetical protein KY386_02630 [Candidatus Parcubacteria bacterium]|nr:hypothetical protein [Candidatus Parcubacteria bacterium]